MEPFIPRTVNHPAAASQLTVYLSVGILRSVSDRGSRTSRRILAKALQIFSRKGYHATAVREICQAAGITKPTLYYFYGSKEGVYRALVDGALDQFKQELVRTLSLEGTAETRLKRVARLYFEAGRKQKDLARFVFSLVHDTRGSAPATDFHGFYEEVIGVIAATARRGVAQGEFRPGSIDTRMLVLMGSLGEALCNHLIAGRPGLTPALADAIVETIIHGWSPHSAR